MGEAALHDLDLSFVVDGQTSDVAHLRFGIRTVTSEMTAQGHLLFRINGEPVLIRGAGYTPEMLLREPPARQEAELRYVRDLGLNTVRLEGKLEDEHFMELCDRMGLLVLAGWCCCDHWEKWDTWKDGELPVAVASLRSQILRLRAHPSLLAWMNGSDGPPPAPVEKAYLDVLAQLAWPNPVVSSATQKPAEHSGPSGVKMLGPYDYEPPIYWYVDTAHGGAYGFNTETGPGPAIPPVESLRRMLPANHLWPIDEQWLYHAGGGPFRKLDIYNDALQARFGKTDSVEDYARVSQMLAYETHRAMFEAFRRNQGEATGVVQWMLNNAWPSLIWHLYDFYLRPGGSYFGAKKANEPVHVQYSPDDRSILVTNATLQPLAGARVTARILDVHSMPRWSAKQELDVAANGARRVFFVPTYPKPGPVSFLRLELHDAAGRLVSTNLYWLPEKDDTLDFAATQWYYTPVKTHADLTALRSLPEATISVSQRTTASEGTGLTRVTLTNQTPHVAFGVHLKLTRGAGGEEVLPVLWDDNYLGLMPGETREVEARYDVTALAGDPAEVEVDGWNVRVASASPGL